MGAGGSDLGYLTCSGDCRPQDCGAPCQRRGFQKFEETSTLPVRYEHPWSEYDPAAEPTALDLPALACQADGGLATDKFAFEGTGLASSSASGVASLAAGGAAPLNDAAERDVSTEGGTSVSPHGCSNGSASFSDDSHHQRSLGAGASSVGEDMERARRRVKDFIDSANRGLTLQVLSHDAPPELATVSLDRRLRTLYVRRGEVSKSPRPESIGLERIVEISVGADVRGDVDHLPVDRHCVTLLMDNFQSLSFRFKSDEERDTFALCLSMFVDGKREEIRQRGLASDVEQ
eukprot:TRINITY_DN37250_c0_g1_i1.p1 TRINITY_DN37250_c0_g1~~TRINITY_DN37250_c0_g1_i1.p1  ORF type:complete len:290 (-),score=55.45 TRINITY_DN37250_c0_g1_i1:138-1007(-)